MSISATYVWLIDGGNEACFHDINPYIGGSACSNVRSLGWPHEGWPHEGLV
jgi:hypothetical protein